MKKNKKIISFKVQSYLSLVPFLGMPIVLFLGFYNIYNVKNRLYVALYFLKTILPMIIFSGVAYVISFFLIAPKENIELKIILFLILSYIILLCISICCLSIQKGMLEKIANDQGDNG